MTSKRSRQLKGKSQGSKKEFASQKKAISRRPFSQCLKKIRFGKRSLPFKALEVESEGGTHL